MPVTGSDLCGANLRACGSAYDDLSLFLGSQRISFAQDGVPHRKNQNLTGAADPDFVAVWEYRPAGTFSTTAIGLVTENSLSRVVAVGDPVPPRPSPTPTPAGTTFTGLSSPVCNGSYAAFRGIGQGFSGAYTKKLSDGVIRTVAEDFSNGITEVQLHGDTDVIIRAGNGIYKGHAEGGTALVPLLLNGAHYDPNNPARTFGFGGVYDINGDLAAIDGYGDSFKKSIFVLDLSDNSVDLIIQEGAAMPGGGTFSFVQRPAISDKMIVFEGFTPPNNAFAGIFAWVNGQIFPIVRIGQTLDAKVVQFLDDNPNALDGRVFGFAVHFTDGSSAAYLAALSPMQLVAAASRKTHGAQNFDVSLPLTGQPGVECRTGGASGNHTVVLTFSNDVTSGNASVTSGAGSVSGSPTFVNKTMTINLTGVANAQTIALSLSSVTDSIAQVMPNTVVSMTLLVGDTTGNKVVNSTDVSQTKLQSGQSVTGANFRQDVTASGAINGTDVSVVKLHVGSGVP